MTDSVTTPSETPNQPAVETPPIAAAPAAPIKAADPSPALSTTPEIKPAAPAAKPAVTPPAPDPATTPVSDAAAKALVDAAAAKAQADEAAKAAASAPETYEVKLSEALVKEGYQIDPEFLPKMTPALKKAGVTQAQLNTIAEGFLEFQAEIPKRMLASDLEKTAKDPTLGGMRYAQTLKEVNLALDAFGDPDFKKFVAKAGIANRLEFVRVFQRIGDAMMRAGDTPSRGEPDGAAPMSRAERMYGKTSKT